MRPRAQALTLAPLLTLFASAAALADDAPAAPTAPAKVEVDLDRAVAVSMPGVAEDLKPVAFRTPDGKEGWILRIPGNRPIATPAYADGLLFVGGGYGSHEFYAFDARTGAVAWKIQTSDDGPTAAVVEDGLVAFNTESCTVVVCEAKTGKVVWQEWLGDPLMSQPAIANGRLFIAYPAGQRGGGGAAQHQQQPANAPAPNLQHSGPTQPARGQAGHRLLCADLRTGKHLWEAPITGDVISAPVVEGGEVVFTCFDGTSFSVAAADGKVLWQRRGAGTSAPVVAGGQVMVTEKQVKDGRTVEGMMRLEPKRGEAKDGKLLTENDARYLEADRGGGVQMAAGEAAKLDASVGFGTAPGAAQLHAANANLGVSTVAGGWAYQGSRAAFRDGAFLNAQGLDINCVDAATGSLRWKARASGRDVGLGGQVFSPPALGRKLMYLASGRGHLLALGREKGDVRFMYALGQPVAFQPALAGGNVYAGTTNGMLVCLKTGDADADGWTAWGGNAQHNKKD